MKTALLTFQWAGSPAAIAGTEIQALVDDPAIAPLATPLGSIDTVLAWGSDLFPLVNDPDLAAESDKFSTVIVTSCDSGNIALRVGANVKVEHADTQGGSFVTLADGRTAMLLDTEDILMEHLDSGGLES